MTCFCLPFGFRVEFGRSVKVYSKGSECVKLKARFCRKNTVGRTTQSVRPNCGTKLPSALAFPRQMGYNEKNTKEAFS